MGHGPGKKLLHFRADLNHLSWIRFFLFFPLKSGVCCLTLAWWRSVLSELPFSWKFQHSYVPQMCKLKYSLLYFTTVFTDENFWDWKGKYCPLLDLCNTLWSCYTPNFYINKWSNKYLYSQWRTHRVLPPVVVVTHPLVLESRSITVVMNKGICYCYY